MKKPTYDDFVQEMGRAKSQGFIIADSVWISDNHNTYQLNSVFATHVKHATFMDVFHYLQSKYQWHSRVLLSIAIEHTPDIPASSIANRSMKFTLDGETVTYPIPTNYTFHALSKKQP